MCVSGVHASFFIPSNGKVCLILSTLVTIGNIDPYRKLQDFYVVESVSPKQNADSFFSQGKVCGLDMYITNLTSTTC